MKQICSLFYLYVRSNVRSHVRSNVRFDVICLASNSIKIVLKANVSFV